MAQYMKWLSHRQHLVERFLEIAERKVSLLDDYGDENWDALPKEINTCLLKLAATDNSGNIYLQHQLWEQTKADFTRSTVPMPRKWQSLKKNEPLEKYVWLRAQLEVEFRTFHEEQKQQPADASSLDSLSGSDFEGYLVKILKEKGFEDVRGTAMTGDQGADLIAKKDGKTVVIQAKRWRAPVGNKAVQEVVGAINFYGADEGWVITSGTFTPFAKALAQKNRVRLIDGYALRNGF
jgi:Restriction endonuclease